MFLTYFQGIKVGFGLPDIEPLPHRLNRLVQHRNNVLLHDPQRNPPIALAFPQALHHFGFRRQEFPQLPRPHIRNEQYTPARILAVRECQQARLTQGIASIARQDMEQVMRVAQAIAVPFEVVVKILLRTPVPFTLVDQALGVSPSRSMNST